MFERFRELLERRTNGDSEGGFTLIELLIVIVVLGILAAIVIFSLTGVTGQSQASACNTDAKSVQTAVQAYESSPPTGIASGTAPTSIAAVAGPTNTGLVPVYLHAAPTATVSTTGYAISLDTTTAGQVDVTTNTITAPTSYDTAGCASA